MPRCCWPQCWRRLRTSPSSYQRPCEDRNIINEASANTSPSPAAFMAAYLTSPAVCPVETAFSYSCLALPFSLTSPTYTRPSIFLWGTKTCGNAMPRGRQSHHNWAVTDMLKLLMNAVLGSSTSKKISWEAFALFKALEVTTVRANRDATVQSTVMLYTSTIWQDGQRDFTGSYWQRHG